MSIPIRRIARVLIANEWITVSDNTFSIEELEFTDEDGDLAHAPLDTYAFKFLTENKDWYYGPLSQVQIFKLKDIAANQVELPDMSGGH